MRRIIRAIGILSRVTYLVLRINTDLLQFLEEFAIVPWWITYDRFDGLKCAVEGILEIVLRSSAGRFAITLRQDVAELTGLHVEVFIASLKEPCCVKQTAVSKGLRCHAPGDFVAIPRR